jgi:hypothetical protein
LPGGRDMGGFRILEHIVTQHPENRVLFTNESGLTVMMRFVVLLCAEERKLLLLGEPI